MNQRADQISGHAGQQIHGDKHDDIHRETHHVFLQHGCRQHQGVDTQFFGTQRGKHIGCRQAGKHHEKSGKERKFNRNVKKSADIDTYQHYHTPHHSGEKQQRLAVLNQITFKQRPVTRRAERLILRYYIDHDRILLIVSGFDTANSNNDSRLTSVSVSGESFTDTTL